MRLLILMRGVPGSGKSTKARDLADGGAIFSTDEFFTNGGKYEFDVTKIGLAHAWNNQRAKEAMELGVSPVVIDNTNVKRKDAKVYMNLAKENGYTIQVAEPDTPWWKKFSQGMSEVAMMELANDFATRNVHGVPVEVIFSMLKGWDWNFEAD